MAERRLVIVESPAKAKTIAGYLGDGYVVESSIGHIRDLPNRAADILRSIRDAGYPAAQVVGHAEAGDAAVIVRD